MLTDDIKKFLNEAPDEVHLLNKVVLIFGVSGALRRNEIYKITVNDVEEKDSALFVNIPETKNNRAKSFAITGFMFNLYKKYRLLRPKNASSPKLFLTYRKGKCTQQVVGLNKIGATSQEVARFLNLPNPERYIMTLIDRSN